MIPLSLKLIQRIREAKQEIMADHNENDIYNNIPIQEHTIIYISGYEEAEEAEEAKVAKEETEEWNIKRKLIELLLFLNIKS